MRSFEFPILTNETESATIKAEAKTSNEEMTATVMAATASETENTGSSMETAIPLTLDNMTYSCTCCPEGDVWFKIEANEEDFYRIYTTGRNLSSMFVYDSTGATLNYATGDAYEDISAVERFFDGQVYYVKVSAICNCCGEFGISFEKAELTTARVRVSADVRSVCGPDTGTSLGTVTKDTVVTLMWDVPQNQKWYNVYAQLADGTYKYGWVNGEYLEKLTSTVKAEREGVNIYLKPEENTEYLLKTTSNTAVVLSADEELILTNTAKINNTWYRVLHEGRAVYVKEADVTLSASWQDLYPEGNDIRVTTSGNALNVMSSPYSNSTVLAQLNDGAMITLMNREPVNSIWYAVYGINTDSQLVWGWCRGDCLEEYVEFGACVLPRGVSVRTGPGTGYENLGTIRYGQQAHTLAKEAEEGSGYKWHKILYNGRICYVFSKDNGKDNFHFYKRWVTLRSKNFNVDFNAEQIRILNNIERCTNKDLFFHANRDAYVDVTGVLLRNGFHPAFIAGILANISKEGTTGKFEDSTYNDDPEDKPPYLIFMDTQYNGLNYYNDNFAAKSIVQLDDVSEVYDMIDYLNNNSTLNRKGQWVINGSPAGFGLGIIQWSFTRSYTLKNLYMQTSSNRSVITKSEAIQAESLMILQELQGSEYSSIYPTWLNNNASILDSNVAAGNAASDLCEKYVRPNDIDGEKGKRALVAQQMYIEMIK